MAANIFSFSSEWFSVKGYYMTTSFQISYITKERTNKYASYGYAIT